MNGQFRNDIKELLDNYFPRCNIQDGKALRKELNDLVHYFVPDDVTKNDVDFALRHAAQVWSNIVTDRFVGRRVQLKTTPLAGVIVDFQTAFSMDGITLSSNKIKVVWDDQTESGWLSRNEFEFVLE